ncbi:hypothetical protein LTR27_011580 [Elasticomyces elasticus]|nr:hypothetical protein LTR27_011580 [Elasticomyces elasticus]
MAGKKGATTEDTAKTTKTRVSSVGAVKKATKVTNKRTKASNVDETSPTQAAQSAASFTEKITGLIAKRFSSVVHSQAVTEFAEFVVIVLQETHRDLFSRQDEKAILQQARKFAGPSGDPGSPTAFITHWMPDHDDESEEGSDSEEEDDSDEEGSEVGGDDDVEVAGEVIVLDDDDEQAAAEVIVLDEDDEPPHIPQSKLKRKATAEAAVPIDTPARKKRPAPLKIKGRRYWRAIHPVKRYTDTFDLGYETMRTLKKLFPNLASQVFLFDLYKRKQKITDASGKRLNGTEPYDHDLVLFGGVVKAAFTSEFGEFESGQKMLIGGRLRTVIHLQHPEWIYKYATAENLQPLKTRLKDLKKLVAGDLDVSIAAINELIEKKSKTPNAVARAEKRAKSAPKPGPMKIPPPEMTAAAAEYFAATKAVSVFLKGKSVLLGLSSGEKQAFKPLQVRLGKAAYAAKMGFQSEAVTKANRERTLRRIAEGTGMFSAEAKAKCNAPETIAKQERSKQAGRERKWEERLKACNGDPAKLAVVEAERAKKARQSERKVTQTEKRKLKKALGLKTPAEEKAAKEEGIRIGKVRREHVDREWAEKKEACKGDPMALARVETAHQKSLAGRETNDRMKDRKEAMAQQAISKAVEDEEKREASELALRNLLAEEKAAKEKADKERADKKAAKRELRARERAANPPSAKRAITIAANIERKWTEKKEACKGDPVESAKVEKAYQKSLKRKAGNLRTKIKKAAKAANKQTPVEEGEEEVEDVVDEDGGFEEDS